MLHRSAPTLSIVPALLLACGLVLARWSRGETAEPGAEERA